jgi:thiol-disulfide isomerase/thioredoxin
MESARRQTYLNVTNPSLPPLRNAHLGRNDTKKVSKRMKRSRIAAALFLSSTIIHNPGVSAFTIGKPGTFNSLPEAIATRRIPSKDSSHSFALDALSFDNPPSEMSDFQKRMRNLVSTPPSRVGKRRPRRNENVPDNLLVIDTLEEFKNVIQGNDDKIIVVRFYAPWCKACKAIAPSFYRLAGIFEEALFIDIPVKPENSNLHQGLGVPSLPFGHIYHPTGGLVEEKKISKKYFPSFVRLLKTYIDGRCDVKAKSP